VLEAALLALGTGLKLPIFASVEFGSGARSELRAGSAPVTSGRPSEPGVMLQLTGLSRVDLASPVQRLTLRYLPRFFVRYPNEFELTRPLFLHAGDAHHEYRASEALTWKSSFRGSAGEVDYTASELALASRRAAPTAAAVLQFVDLEGTTGLTQTFDEKTSGSVAVLAGYNSPYDELSDSNDDAALAPYPAHTRFGVDLEAAHRSSERTTLALPLRARYDRFSTGTEFTSLGALLVVRQIHGPLTRSELSGGALVVKRLDEPERDVEAFPQARVELTLATAPSETQRFEQRIGVGIEPFLDPVRAEYRLLGGVELVSSLELRPRWTAAVALSGSTTVSSDPLEPPELETYVSAQTPIRYRTSDTSFLEFGIRTSARGPHFKGPPFELTDFELWGYVAFAFVLGNARPAALY
jgi:hypothetical protein